MKNLLLIRHAKSSWDFPGASDHDRPLNQRGERDVPGMAAALSQRGVRPDQIVTSTANRARTTAAMIAESMGFPTDAIREEQDLYLASPMTILRIVQQLDENSSTALVFGHNPGMHDATEMICGTSIDHFPTLSVARIELELDYWGEVDAESGLLLEHLYPKMLQTG